MKTFLRILMPLAILALVGCAGQSLMIANGIDQQKIDKTRGRTITGSAGGFQLFLFIPIAINGRQARAYQSLLAQANGDSIADVKVREAWFYGFVGTVYTTTLEATAYPKVDK
jgi:hypothetical protein